MWKERNKHRPMGTVIELDSPSPAKRLRPASILNPDALPGMEAQDDELSQERPLEAEIEKMMAEELEVEESNAFHASSLG